MGEILGCFCTPAAPCFSSEKLVLADFGKFFSHKFTHRIMYGRYYQVELAPPPRFSCSSIFGFNSASPGTECAKMTLMSNIP